jgi:ferredoxin-thioredoxin reductase catalytic subunit
LRKLQELQGYYLNNDRKRVFDLLASLLENKKRYGEMCCPCGLASGEVLYLVTQNDFAGPQEVQGKRS